MPEKRITRVEFPARTFSPEQPPPTKQVAAYARVSTMKDAQENSLQAQQEYFTEYIQRHPGWVFAGMYSDDGISGLSIRERDGFNSMVTDALDGKIDLILTKSLSRFARNTVDALTTIRSLKAAGVAVYFQKENINTMDSAGEFLITLMSSFAEEESRSISENVTWAVRHRYAQGIYHLPGLLLGYQRSQDGEIQVDEAGARVVRFIYLLALAGKSSTDICRILIVRNNGDLFGNVKEVFAGSFPVNEIYRCLIFIGILFYLGTVFQKPIDLPIGCVQTILQIGGGFDQFLHRPDGNGLGIAMIGQPCNQLLFIDITVFPVFQIADIVIPQLGLKEIHYALLGGDFRSSYC